MEKKWSLIIVLIVVVSLLLSVFGFTSADSGCTLDDSICFEREVNQKYIGSYQVIDSSGTMLKSGQWKNSIDLLFNGEGCIYPLEGTQSTFYADWSRGWYWDTKTDVFGYQCYKLKKY